MGDKQEFEKADYWKLNQGESFWEDALEHFLKDRLGRIYTNKKFYRKLIRWIAGNNFKSAVIHLTDIPSDPFVIKLYKDRYEAHTEQKIKFVPDVELTTDHITLMHFGYSPIYIIPNLIFKMLQIKSKRFKDGWMFLRLVLL